MSSIRVATWNLWWRFGDAERRHPAITSVLGRAQPDVVALQEVWQRDQIHMAGAISAELGFHTVFAPASDSSQWQRTGPEDAADYSAGMAILSRWPMDSTIVIPLPAGDEADESRFAISTLVATPVGSIRVTNVHLNSGWWHNEIRRAQLHYLLNWLAEQEPADLPMVLAGDFNAGPDFDEMRPLIGKAAPYDTRLPLIDSWGYLNPDDPGHTWDRRNPHTPGQVPSERIDYIFTGRSGEDGIGRVLTAERFGVQPTEGVVASDHYGVIVEMRTSADS